ncbi:MAG: tRNA threonylcarbamoyladenosine biosynthesis protein TsaE [Chlamydiae bacterium]|nr:tRNA threonylcarbamoyladenosine biosynthesis protein TsaE [Chlamydiota bacterium]
MKIEFITNSAQETFELGASLGKRLHANSIIAFYGELAAGKTTLIKGVAHAIGGIDPNEINSPTFTYLNIYDGLKSFYHFDLYRMKGAEQFLQMGFDEYFDAEGICCVEWSERIRSILPKKRIDIFLEHQNQSRKIIIESEYEEISF